VKKEFRIREQDGALAIFEVRLGQAVNPRLYYGLKRKFLEFIINWCFIRKDKKIEK
tara:strand:+ start:599 stop:766 length:168 start_codon:yes stop_codon:yes gene_type:complete